MNRSERDVTSIVRSWLEEGADRIPDRVLDAVEGRLPATHQRRAGWLARRFPIMNSNTLRFGVAAAAVVALALIGWRLLPGSNTGVEPNPTPTPSIEPTPIPTLPSAGDVSPGRYLFDWNVGSSIQVPAGWRASQGGLVKHEDLTGEVSFGPAAPDAIWSEITVIYADACMSEGALEAVGPTVDELVTALDDQLGTDAVVTDLEIDGRPATRVDLAPAADLDRSTCRVGEDGPLQIWADPNENNYFSLAPGFTGVAWILDLDGERVVLFSALGPDVPASDVTELEAIVASVRFAP